VEEAGTDFVGVCVDAGNAVWSMEDPHLVLETLAPYILTSHTRDSAVWPVDTGAAVAWTRMGDGNVDIETYLRTFVEKCPGRCPRDHRDSRATDDAAPPSGILGGTATCGRGSSRD
jgi:hypothetical protein